MKFVDGWHITDEDAAKNLNPVRRQSANDVRVIDIALRYVKSRRLVIQAGARVGLWPYMLAQEFARVIAFEPENRNFACARKNTEHLPNVDVRHAALGREAGRLMVDFSEIQSGSHQIDSEGDEPCDVVTIDSLSVNPDAIFLDIEGFELYALEGALETLARCKPLLVIEQNDARLRYGIDKSQIVGLLKPFGYAPIDRCYKDIIYQA